MARPTKRMLERQLSALCTESAGAPPEARVFVSKCRAWLELDSNRDGRGTKAGVIRDVYHATVRFRQALQARSHGDSSVRRTAEKAVTAVRHERFPQLQQRLRTLHGRVSKAGKRIAEERRRDAERVLELDENVELRELRSVTSLQRVGRALGNCVARESHAKEYLRDADTEMWALFERAQQHPLCLLRVDTSTREVDELEGPDASTPRLKRRLAFKILKALGVSGDDEPAFAQVGAFQAFLVDGQAPVKPIETGGRLYWVWSFRGGAEVVIATKSRNAKRALWSRFLRHGTGSVNHRRRRRRRSGFVGSPSNGLSEGELAALVVDHPSFAGRLRATPV